MSKGRTALVIVFLFGSLTACGNAEQEEDPNDLLLMNTRAGVASIKTGASTPTFRSATAAVPAGDWSSIVRTERDGESTAVIGVDPSTGDELWRRTAPGRLRPKVVAPDGAYVALAPDHIRYAAQWKRTTITVSGRDVAKATTIHLDGNFEPEAFSTDGKTLFVVQYLPAARPSKYQVRQLDVATGVVSDVFSVDKELQEAMRGTARVQEISNDGKRLYTLYSTRTKHGEHSFIHVLSLDELWAHCIDLPHGFGMSGDAKTALTVRDDGKRLYVTDTSHGAVVEVDTQKLQVLREEHVEELANSTGATVAIDESKNALYAAAGTKVGAIDLDDLAWTREWEMPSRIKGLQIAPASQRLYLGLRDEIGVIDLNSGDVLKAFDPPGLESITKLGPVTPGLDPAREKFSCAC